MGLHFLRVNNSNKNMRRLNFGLMRDLCIRKQAGEEKVAVKGMTPPLPMNPEFLLALLLTDKTPP